MSGTFDAIVVGSGMSGGWAAKELCERGFKTLVLERGRKVEHGGEEYTDHLSPWELENRGLVPEDEFEGGYSYLKNKQGILRTTTRRWYASNDDHPYSTSGDDPAIWIRGYQLGGRSMVWGRHVYRLGDLDFEANKRDGHGVDWPIRYADLKPWYDHVERFIGVAGSAEGLPQLPDGVFQPPFELNCAEAEMRDRVAARWPDRRVIPGRLANLTQPTEEQQALGRGACQSRIYCSRGCSYGAYFSSLSATLPAAERTGNMTLRCDAIVDRVLHDPRTGRATGVRVIDAKTRQVTDHHARLVFLCASAIGTAHILLNSRSDTHPNGLANRSDAVGRYLMDHIVTSEAEGVLPGLEDRYYAGRRPGGLYIPRFRNLGSAAEEPFLRGYAYQGSGFRKGWERGAEGAGVGAALKAELRRPGPWVLRFNAMGEMLPYAKNRVTLHPTRRDRWGVPLAHIEAEAGDNERRMAEHAALDIRDMLLEAGCRDVKHRAVVTAVGFKNHEMGTARMGRDPNTSVLNGWNQAHDVPNLFITDGAAMTSSATQNPSLTYMALTARACAHAAELMKTGVI
jgi:choline dehydrogenase-like flavoprotein